MTWTRPQSERVPSPPEEAAPNRFPHKNSAIQPALCASPPRPLPRRDPIDGPGPLDFLVSLFFSDSQVTSPKMSAKTSPKRVTVEQTPFVIPDLTIKDLLSAIP